MPLPYDKNNIFAKIIRGEIPAEKVFEDEQILAINDIQPAADVHVLIMPKGEYTSFDDFIRTAPVLLQTRFFKVIPELARKLWVDNSGYRLIANCGPDASQSVLHFHMHLIGGRPLGGLLPDDTHAR